MPVVPWRQCDVKLDGQKKVTVNVGQHSLEKIMAMATACAGDIGTPLRRCISVRCIGHPL